MASQMRALCVWNRLRPETVNVSSVKLHCIYITYADYRALTISAKEDITDQQFFFPPLIALL